MQFIKNMLFGFRAYGKAIKFIFQHRFYWYLIAPALLMLVIYYLGSLVQHHKFVPDVKNMNDIVWYLVYLLLEISIALLLMKFAKYLVVTLLSPLLAHVSQECERILTGNTYKWNFQQLISDIRRATQIVIRNIMWEYFFFLIILFVSFVGWENPKSSPIFYLSFGIGFYYYGFSFLDYINERRRLTMDESIIFVRNNRGLAIVIGAMYSIMILVPVRLEALFNFSGFTHHFWATLGNFLLNLVLWISASTAPILAIVAATIGMHDLVDLSKNQYSDKPE
ncbi:MAG: EI24 domain-containing protein [Crocinitomicaceae bacterium]|nr:EI24 domain-containing protein [Crocinitomicaceae bacterium]